MPSLNPYTTRIQQIRLITLIQCSDFKCIVIISEFIYSPQLINFVVLAQDIKKSLRRHYSAIGNGVTQWAQTIHTLCRGRLNKHLKMPLELGCDHCVYIYIA